MQTHNDDTIKDERTQFFRKMYLSVYWKDCVWEVSGRPNKDWNILSPPPPTLLAITAFLSRSPGLLNRGLGAQPLLGRGSHSSIFSPTDLNFLPPGLYNNLTSTYFLRASQFALKSTLRLDLWLNPGLTDLWKTLYPLGQWFARIYNE